MLVIYNSYKWGSKLLKRLLLVAGPPGAGKSTLISALHTGKLPSLAEYLNILPEQCFYLEAVDLPYSDWQKIDTLVLHYDLFRQYKDGSFRHLDLLFDHFTVVEVLLLEVTGPSLLWRNSGKMSRMLARIYSLSKPGYRKNLSAVFRKQWLFLRPTVVGNLYQHFITFLGKKQIKAVYPVNTSGFSLDPVRALQKQLFRTPLNQYNNNWRQSKDRITIYP